MKHSVMRAATSLAGTRLSDSAPTSAGSLALALARAATASGTSRSRLRTVLGELGEALAASLVACYSAENGKTSRCVALVSMNRIATGEGATRKQMAWARSAAATAATTWDATQKTSRTSHPPVEPQSSERPIGPLHVLPLETTPLWLGLVVVWPDEEQAQVHADILTQVSPLLGVLIKPLIQPAPRRARAGNSRGTVRRDTTPARKATRALDAPMAVLSHELRNPLNTLAGFLEIVVTEQVGPLNDRQREFLEYARASAARIASVIEQTRVGAETGGE